MGERRGDTQDARTNQAYEDLKRWARTTDLPDPVRWGELETRITLEPVPSRTELETELGRPGLARVVGLGVGLGVTSVLLLVQVLLIFGSSLVGLGLVVAYTQHGYEPSYQWDEWINLLFLAPTVMAVVPVLIWASTKRRGWVLLGISGVTALASAGSVALLGAGAQVDPWSTYRVLAAVAAVAGLASFVFLLLVGRPSPRSTFRERLRRVPPEERWLRGMRAGVLEELTKRGLVNGADSTAIMELPPGTWQQLESLPDGRVVRRNR